MSQNHLAPHFGNTFFLQFMVVATLHQTKRCISHCLYQTRLYLTDHCILLSCFKILFWLAAIHNVGWLCQCLLLGNTHGPAHSVLYFAQCMINAHSLQQTAKTEESCMESVVNSEKSFCWTGDPLLWWAGEGGVTGSLPY